MQPLRSLVTGMGVLDRPAACVTDDPGPAEAMRNAPCAFCGTYSGKWQFAYATENPEAVDGEAADPGAACPLCHLAGHLERSRIDDEAMLVWLPEVSQPALNTIVRQIHIQLRDRGDSLLHGAPLREDTKSRHPLYHARTAIAARASAASDRLGTSLPSELASALRRLSPAARAHREALLGGLRVLSLGRFFSDGTDVYPAIIDLWREQVTAGVAGKGL